MNMKYYYNLYVNVDDFNNIRLTQGQLYGKFRTFKKAREEAIQWLKEDKDRKLINVKIFYTGPKPKLKVGQRYDIAEALQSFNGESLYFSNVLVIYEPYYNVTGEYIGEYPVSEEDDIIYATIEKNW